MIVTDKKCPRARAAEEARLNVARIRALEDEERTALLAGDYAKATRLARTRQLAKGLA